MKINDGTFRARYGSWAVVAGASIGLGAEFATQLAARGLNVVIVARQADRLVELSRQLSTTYQVQLRPLPIDLSAPDAPALIAEQTRDIDVGLLIYNAALSIIGPFLDQPLDQHLRELDTNTRAPLALAYLLGQSMRTRRRGGIILMSSLSAMLGSALIANYAATKAYNQVLAEGLWDELRAQGVDVLACCASTITTPNYLASQPKRSRLGSFGALPPEAVVTETLNALGRQPSLIPGRSNRLAAFFIRRMLPRRVAIQMMGQTLRKMYS
ncbi:MAG TPA: SDR family NAD(P)-dependent oxidoreductase [Anaerolineae bacterium]|nr:SDR family NAD(P)-dependent oxidoreductase [Anaerolineae bacterium]